MSSPSSPIKVAVFDLGKVLLHFDYSIAAERLAAHSTSSAEEIRRLIDQSELLSRYETGQLDRLAFFEAFSAATGFRAGISRFAADFADIFTPIAPMVGLHARLRARGIPTFIFSNTNDIAIEHIRRQYPFFNTFTGYIYSYEERSMKPSPEIYQTVEKRTGRTGREILYIDDRAENIVTGRNRDWSTIHHQDPESSLVQIERLLG